MMRALVVVLVAACANGISALPAGESGRFTVSGVNDDREVEKFYLDFQKAVADGDRKRVAGMMNYPLRVNFRTDSSRRNYRIIRSRDSFLKVYDRIFDRTLKRFIARTTVNDIWANYHGIATPRGEIWIGVFCQRADCDSYHIKVRTIGANSVFLKEARRTRAGRPDDGTHPARDATDLILLEQSGI
ncbi:MAG TPA: hypothetical protein VF586_20830 [Pyrinomonadaceae bacterium]|jgi:hypothetical protein